jgi:hypothetical protein
MQVSRCVRRVGSVWRPRRGVVGRVAVRTLQTQVPRYALRFASGSGLVLGGCLAALLLAQQQSDAKEAVDYKALAEDIKKLIESAPKTYDDGRYQLLRLSVFLVFQRPKRALTCCVTRPPSYGPLFIRLAWHCAGSYSKVGLRGFPHCVGSRPCLSTTRRAALTELACVSSPSLITGATPVKACSFIGFC